MLKNELFKNYNGFISVIVLIVATIYYYFGRPENISDDTRYLASLIFILALSSYNLIMSLHFNLSKKWETFGFSFFFFLATSSC